MLEQVSSALTTVITMLGSAVNAVVGNTGALKSLMPLIAISISVSIFSYGIKLIRGATWGF